MRWLPVSLVLAAALAAAALVTPTAGAASTICPSGGTPAPGSTITGGLEVDGFCDLSNVTVYGGITVDPSAAAFGLFIESGTVYGGIVVNGGELDIGINPPTGVPTGGVTTVSGGITLNGAFDFDIHNATVNGPVAISGSPPEGSFAGPTVCGNTFNGSVSVRNVSYAFPVFIGDPEDMPFGIIPCPGNTITGSLSISNSSFLEVEGNSVGGSVLLSASTLELNGNTIGGILSCANGTLIVPGEAGDPSGNTVRGTNNCA
jgi:hypothetical protein